jgi:hypothetical protein
MMAWLSATPRPDEQTKAADPKYERKRLSRQEQMKKDGIPIRMPPNPLPHIVAWFVEIGISEAAGMGAAPLSWGAINAWQLATGINLSPWEARLIRRLSTEYLAESRKAESENHPAPWRAEVTQREREIEQAILERVLG